MVIFNDSIPKVINTKLLKTNLIRLKVISKRFRGATSNEFIHNVKSILQNLKDLFETPTLQMSIDNLLKRGFVFDVVTNIIMNTAKGQICTL